jgi:hypothetical protein
MANFVKGLSKLKLKEAPAYIQEHAGESLGGMMVVVHLLSSHGHGLHQ